MGKTFRFTCGSCGEVHEGLPDYGFNAPLYYDEIPEEERETRCRLSDDLFILDDEYFFVRAVLLVPINQFSESFGWGVWTSLSKENFLRYKELWDAKVPAGEGPYFGWLSNRIPLYPDTLNLKVAVHLQDDGNRPLLELEPTDHPLALEQREGISLERAQEIVEGLLHQS